MNDFGLLGLVRIYTKDATQNEIISAIPQAFLKLEHIIEREGDMESKRWDPEYLAQLISEQIRADRAFNRSMAAYRERLLLSLETA